MRPFGTELVYILLIDNYDFGGDVMKYALMLMSFVFGMLLVLSCSHPGGSVGELIDQFEEAMTQGDATDGDDTTQEGEQSSGSESSSEESSSSENGETSDGSTTTDSSVEEEASGTDTGDVVSEEESTDKGKGKGKDKDKKDEKEKKEKKDKKDKETNGLGDEKRANPVV